MTGIFWAQRRAERFDSLLGGERVEAVDPSTAELLELVGALRALPEAQPRPEFVAGLRERLMLAAQTELVAAPREDRSTAERLTVRPAKSRRERRIGIALGTVAILGATTSMAVASQGAIPGDTLYPLKRAIENAQAGFSVGDDSKGETILANASGRLDEVGELSRKDEPDAQLVTDTLVTFSGQASEAGNLLLDDYEQHGHEQSITQLHDFTHESIASLGALEPLVPDAARPALRDAAKTVFALDAAATQLCPACGEPITEVPPQLLAGRALGGPTGADPQASGQLPGAGQPSTGAQNGGESHGPSGLNPPETPITLPSLPVDPTDAVGGALPSSGAGTGGHGGQGKPHKPPVDLGPVTNTVDNTVDDTVKDVVDEVVDGVNQVLGGLTGPTP